MKQILNPGISKDEYIANIFQGGNFADNPEKARDNLGIIGINDINRLNGVAGLDDSGLISTNVVPDAIRGSSNNFVSLSGAATSGKVETTLTFTINNYDSFTNYTVSVSRGTVSRIDDVITVTLPDTSGPLILSVNDRSLGLTAIDLITLRPTITTPVNNATRVSVNTAFQSSAFQVQSGVTGDSHLSTDWQISKFSDFSVIAKSSMSDTTNLTSWSVTGLDVLTQYYVRVRYRANINGYSQWSIPISYVTSATAPGTVTKTPGTSTFTVPADIYSLQIEAAAGGGSGGSSETGDQSCSGTGGGGGGGGSYVVGTISVIPGDVLTLITGSGAPGPGGADSWGSTGGTTKITGTNINIELAGGGGGGPGRNNYSDGYGVAGVGGNLVSLTGFTGYSTKGSNGGVSNGPNCGGGCCAGVAGVNSFHALGGAGGIPGWASGGGGGGGASLGAGGRGGNGNGAGSDPRSMGLPGTLGGGGGGASDECTTANSRGAGGNGVIKLSWG